jgi:ribosome production factor 2
MVKSIRKRREDGEVLETLPKNSVVLKGNKSSPLVSAVLVFLHKLRTPSSVLMSKRHENLHPFENPEVVEKFVDQKQASWFVIGSNSKKRPNNLIFGRLFDSETLDLVEFKLDNYSEIPSIYPFPPGIHPLLLFQGEVFETNEIYTRIKNMFIDFFGGKALEKVDTRGLNKLIAFTATSDNKIHFRCYQLPQMEEICSKFTLELRRSKLAPESKFKISCTDPKLKRKVKNIETNALKQKRGRVHVQQQDIKTIALKQRKAKAIPDN